MRTTKNVSKSLNDISAQTLREEGFTYSKMMKTLTRDQHKVPDSINDSAPAFLDMTILESKTAQTSTKITDYPSNLNESINHIGSNVEQLAKNQRNPNAIQMMQYYLQQFAPIKGESLERIEQRKKLIELIKEFIGNKNQVFAEVLKALEVKKPSRQIDALIDPLTKRQQELLLEVEKLNINENALQVRLDSLLNESNQTVRSIMGPSAFPPKPGETPTLG